jgi:2-dehydro-3-deoxyphosphogluconate aldolase / (4S)-4-hydroxy-2-oxoglutarate aldolase
MKPTTPTTPADPLAFTELRRTKLVAAIRAATPAAALAASHAIADGGITLIEITYSVPDAPRVIRELSSRSGIVVGAGTVLTRDQARAALDAGARFIIAPNVSAAVAEQALAARVMYCPGAYTTGEIIAARDAGAHVIKVYPVGVAGGPAYIRVIRDPLPDIPMLAAGGTNLDNTNAFLEAGCVGVGLGAALADARLAAQDTAEIARRARAFVALVAGAEVSPRAGA